ncbi:hypothetical protein DV515_00015584, partial [Chloebia gouldiae]
MAGGCGAMAAGLRGGLPLVCSSRWPQRRHLSLGAGARLARAGAAAQLQLEYDAVVIGAGHNGLVAAAYLQQAGLHTAVLEKRHVLGGAAVTEEIVPGFKFSRASYLLSLLRPQIYADLELQVLAPTLCWAAGNSQHASKGTLQSGSCSGDIPVLQRHGLRVFPRDPYSFTPLLEDRSPPRSLLLGHDMAQTQQQIAQFSQKDAQAYPEYEAFMGHMVLALDPLLDAPPVDTAALGKGSLLQQLRSLRTLKPLLQAGLALGRQLPHYYEVLTAPISKILDHWFESEPLKATLATDAVIGAMSSPHTPGSGYVLLHHVMGELEGRRGAWGYVAGGMGALSQAIAQAATARGAHIFAEKAVCHVLLGSDGEVQGVALQDGTEVRSKLVLSNASPQITFLELTPQEKLPKDFVQRIRQLDTRSPVTKINGRYQQGHFHCHPCWRNIGARLSKRLHSTSSISTPCPVAVDRLPSFLAAPNARNGQPLPHHQCSIHLNCEGTQLLHQAFTEAAHGHPSSRPMIELCIPSALDPGLAPPGCHVVSLFTQYTPSMLAGGRSWDEQARNAYADRVFDCVEDYAPGFKASVIGRDILTPPDLERIFGLPGGVGTMGVNSEHHSGASASGHMGLGQAQLTHKALLAEHLPWRDVSGPAVLHPASPILLWLPIPNSWPVPVWKWSPPRRRSDGSSRTQCRPGGYQGFQASLTRL